MTRSAYAWLAGVAALVGGPGLVAAQDGDRNPEQVFKDLDKNEDGKITADEVGEDRARFFERLVRVGDKNDDKALSKEEFTAALAQRDRPAEPRPAEGRPGEGRPGFGFPFDRLDANGDGKVTLEEVPAEFRERMKPLFERLGKDAITREDLPRLGQGAPGGPPPFPFDRFDANGDGKVTLDEVPEEARDRVRPIFERLGKDAITREDLARLGGPGGGGPGPVFFRVLDENKDGRLSKEEWTKAADKFAELDTNKDGQLDGAELFGAPGGPRLGQPGADARPLAGQFAEQMFQRIDRNGDGKIGKDEAPERMRENFARLDKNSDDAVDLEEFRAGFPGARRPDGEQPRRPRRPNNE